MKRHTTILLISTMLTSMSYSQQWQGSSSSTGKISRAGDITANELTLGKYGGSLLGDPDPFNIYSDANSGNRKFLLFGNGGAVLSLRALDGDIEVGPEESPNASISNYGTIRSYTNYGLEISPSSGDAIIRRGTPGHLMISSNGGTSDVRFNYNYGGGSGGISIFDGGTTNYAKFHVRDSGSLNIWTKSGKIGIGYGFEPKYLLDINGTMRAKEVIVETNWPDYVFGESYRLRSLSEVESHIKERGHLPDVPSAAVVESEGLSVGEAQKIMMQKIEELTLYMIEKDKQIETLQARVAELESN